ncbi:hypothetical protein D3C86_1666600 [compost metagenome]
MCLKWSRSRNSSAPRRLWRLSRAICWLRRSINSARLGRLVSGSWYARWRICAWAFFNWLTSRAVNNRHGASLRVKGSTETSTVRISPRLLRVSISRWWARPFSCRSCSKMARCFSSAQIPMSKTVRPITSSAL